MKKTYIKPAIQQHLVELTPLMQASNLGKSVDPATVTDGEYSNSLSRGGGWFDDDDDY